MTKKTYIQPCISIILLQQRHHLLNVSGVTTTSTSSDVNLGYKENGDDPGNGW